MIRKGDIFCNESKSNLEKQKKILRILIRKSYEYAIKEEFVAENSNMKKHFEAELIPLPFCNSICHSQRLVLSCMTSITVRKMNEVGLVSVLCLLCAKAAGAPKHREHLQTESNEAAGRAATHPPCTNQFS